MQPFKLTLLATACAALSATHVAAQPAAPQPTGATSALEEVVVTARRRSENLQDVPVAIQALSAATLVQRGIQNESDLQTAVPGLLVRTNNNQFQLNYVMRGESFEPYSGSVPGVQPYVNEVALSGNAAAPFYDLENVQVLKGPQGTLFGRNSTGGAVLYQTAHPSSEFGGYASVQYSRFDRVVAEGGVNIPIGEDKVLLRLAGTYQSGGAFVHNIYNDKMEGDAELKSGRLTLVLKPSDRFTNTTMLQYTDLDATNVSKVVTYVAPCGVGSAHACWMTPQNAFYQQFVSRPQGTYFPGWPDGQVYGGGLAGLPGYLKSQGKYTASTNGTGINRAIDTLIINTTAFELSDTMTLKNIFGFSRTKRRSVTDNDNTPYPFLQTGCFNTNRVCQEWRDTRQISNELQLQGTALDGKLTYIVGAFYAKNEAIYDSPLTGFSYVPAANLPVTFALRYRAKTQDKATAVFTQQTYAVTDRLNITAGVRASWDKLSILHLPGSTFFGAVGQNVTEKDISYTLTADYKLTEEFMAYVSHRRSWRVGGYNPFVPTGVGNTATAAQNGNYFPKETVEDVEVGAKFAGRIGGVPVRLNADAYYVWAKNIEKTGTTIVAGRVTSATLSIPAGEVFGIEVDGDIRPTPWLTLGGTFNYTYGKYTKNKAVLFGQPVVFDTFPDTPRYSGTVYADITQDLGGDAGSLRYHVDAYAQSSFHLTSLGNSFIPGDTIKGYALLNARIDWSEPMGARGITATLFAKNLTNKYYFTGGGGGVQANATNSGNFGAPRTYGVGIRADF